MLAAFTGSPSSLAMVTGTPAAAAACVNKVAGRACRPTELRDHDLTLCHDSSLGSVRRLRGREQADVLSGLERGLVLRSGTGS